MLVIYQTLNKIHSCGHTHDLDRVRMHAINREHLSAESIHACIRLRMRLPTCVYVQHFSYNLSYKCINIKIDCIVCTHKVNYSPVIKTSFCRPDLDPNCLQWLSVDEKSRR